MTKNCLNPYQRRVVEMIENLPFGRIEQLRIRGGAPSYDPAPRIIQEIKLASEPHHPPECAGLNLRLRKEFESLLNQLSRLDEAVVDIEVRHGLPFRLIIERRCPEAAEQSGER